MVVGTTIPKSIIRASAISFTDMEVKLRYILKEILLYLYDCLNK